MDSSLVSSTTPPFSSPPFSTLLDPRLLLALADLGFTHPTLVQEKAIPLVLQGKDVLARARTGSGKTGGYGVPAVQRVLEELKNATSATPVIQVLILVPTRELAQQVTNFVKSLTKYCEDVKVLNVTAGGSSGQNVPVTSPPHILVATPTRLLALLQSRSVTLPSLSLLIIDEADLILSYGHSADLQRLLDPSQGWLPKVGVQGVLMSATLGSSGGDVEKLKGWALRNPAILTLQEPTLSSSLLTHYTLTASEPSKFLLIYVLLKLKLVRGKVLIFVNTIDRGYRVKLFLEQFGVGVGLLNGEMPMNSRYHIVEEFNRGKYDYIVATDESDLPLPELVPSVRDAEEEEEDEEEAAEEASEPTLIPSGRKGEDEAEEEEEDEDEDEEDGEEEEALPQAESSKAAGKRKATSPPPKAFPKSKKQKKQRNPDKSFGVSRGIDFVSVSCVINFDLPTTPTSYVHRVGRTARAGQSGLAISFVVPRKDWGKDKNVSLEGAKHDEKVIERIRKEVKEDMGSEIKEWDWGGRSGEVEGFRYRMEDALRSVTGKRVAEARREEMRRELLNSEKLKAHFAANPLDFSYLRHDAPLHPTRIQPHMKHVPQYLMPKIARVPLTAEQEGEGSVPFSNRGRGRGRGLGRGGRGGRGGAGRGGRGGKKVDPLKRF